MNPYGKKLIKFTHEDLRKAAALKIMEHSGGVSGIKWGSNLTYNQAYDKVLQIEAFNEQANRVLISLAVGGAGSVVVRGGYYYIMTNPYAYEAILFTRGATAGTPQLSTSYTKIETIGFVAGQMLKAGLK